MSDRKQHQLDAAARLQDLWLNRMEALLLSGDITSADMTTLYKFFKDNGWSVDPARLPKGLKDKLQANLDPNAFEDTDADVIDLQSRMHG